MFESDFDRFVELLDAVYSLHGKTLPATAKALFFRSLAAYPLTVVRAAIDAHVKDSQRGQFPPKPADLIAQIEDAAGNDSRPGSEEAWAIAVQAFDETSTVMMTDEISEAIGVARPIFEIGDEVGARMAFREVYARIVSQSRSNGVAVSWWPSLGSDVEGRKEVLERAVTRGLLPAAAPVLQGALPAPAGTIPLLAAIADMAPSKPAARETLEALRKMLERDPEEDERRRLERVQSARAEVEARKVALLQQAQRLGLSDGSCVDVRGAA
jgi:hypothetical protein